jgi:hypothetical protein
VDTHKKKDDDESNQRERNENGSERYEEELNILFARDFFFWGWPCHSSENNRWTRMNVIRGNEGRR